jgi:hypothetical protein
VAKSVRLLLSRGGRERFIEMGFGRNGAVVSPWSVPFFWLFSLFDFVSCGGKKGGGGETYPSDPLFTSGMLSSLLNQSQLKLELVHVYEACYASEFLSIS